MTEGDSLEATLDNVRDAIQLYLEDLLAAGESIPVESAPVQLVTVEV